MPPVRIRVGIHTGSAVVGNIGAPGRINYTLVGDVANTAQRIENIAKECMTNEDETVVLVSKAVLQAAESDYLAEPIGRRVLRGRQEATDVFRLF